ncbi:S1C family serine protease [Salinarchaeum laminariae]|uniref:S1C family serine protease n=1 Tax=Salinarchaeum laminariae TaxID=869888 RepID=UPI0020C08E76|nr:trypsin-like peptidase domain-containing protein [Salinarchaeum laminariae]
MSDGFSRRDVLATLGAGAMAAVAGCSEPFSEASDDGGLTRAAGLPPTQAQGTVYTEVYQEAIDSVALLEVYGGQAGQGSAFVYQDDLLVTNHHVVDGADTIDVQYADNDWTGADVVATDPHTDLGVIEVDERPDYATALSLADEKPIVGQEVMALGNPLGYDASVSRGIVSGTNRTLSAPTGFSIPNAVQTTASVNPGNSGGPLVDMDANVVAVINSGGAENIGFGISAAVTDWVVPELIEDGEIAHTYVGIRTYPVDRRVAIENDLDEVRGVMVAEVVDGGPADGVLEPAEDEAFVGGRSIPIGGDVIVGIDGTTLQTRHELSTYLALETVPHETVEITVIRDGEEQAVEMTFGERPAV